MIEIIQIHFMILEEFQLKKECMKEEIKTSMNKL
jgi:hypothetical protein